MAQEISDDHRLVPKPGKTKEFLQAFENMTRIAGGTLGWDGQAELMYEAGLYQHLGIKKGPKAKVVPKIKKMLQDSYLTELYAHGEWLPKEEAEKRVAAEKVLFGT